METSITKGGLLKSLKNIGVDNMGHTALTGLDTRACVQKGQSLQRTTNDRMRFRLVTIGLASASLLPLAFGLKGTGGQIVCKQVIEPSGSFALRSNFMKHVNFHHSGLQACMETDPLCRGNNRPFRLRIRTILHKV